MKKVIIAAICMLPGYVLSQTTNCSVYGNSVTCQTYVPPKVNPDDCGSAATCFMRGYMRARDRQQDRDLKLRVEQERLEQLHLQNERLRLENSAMENGKSVKPPDAGSINDNDLKAAYCLGVFRHGYIGGSGSERDRYKSDQIEAYLSSRGLSIDGSPLESSRNQGRVDWRLEERERTDFLVQCSKNGGDVAVCSKKYRPQDPVVLRVDSCREISFLP